MKKRIYICFIKKQLLTFIYLFMKSLEKFIDRISTLLFGNQKNVTSKLF